MILVVGGAYQGKFKFARELLNAERAGGDARVADGETDPPEEAFECGIVDHFHEYIRRFFIDDINIRDKDSGDAENSGNAYAENAASQKDNIIFPADSACTAKERVYGFCDVILRSNPDVIIVSDLIGGGIVPIDAGDREWRDLSGEACQYLAGRAMKVYRVICGIPQILKGMG